MKIDTKIFFWHLPETLAEDWAFGLGEGEATSLVLGWFGTWRICPGGELYRGIGDALAWLAGCESLILAKGTPEICFRFWFSLTTSRTGRLPGELIGWPAWTVVTMRCGVWFDPGTGWVWTVWPGWTGWTRGIPAGRWTVRIGVPVVTVTVCPGWGVTGWLPAFCGKMRFWTCLTFCGVPLWTCPFLDTNWNCWPGTSCDFSTPCILMIWFPELGRTGVRVGVVHSSRFTRRRGGPPEDEGIKMVWPWTCLGPYNFSIKMGFRVQKKTLKNAVT